MSFPWDASKRENALLALSAYNTNYRLGLNATNVKAIVAAIADADPRGNPTPPAPVDIVKNLNFGLSDDQAQGVADTVTTALG